MGWTVALGLMVSLALPGEAAVIITGQSGGTQLGQSCGNGGNTAGWKFTVGPTDLEVTALGEYDAVSDGLEMDVEVGVWDSSGTLLGMVTVPTGTMPPLIGSFRYQALGSTFVLQSLETYTIGSRCTGQNPVGGYAPLDGPSFTFASDFSSAGGRYNNGGLNTTFSEPTMDLGGSIFLGPNLEYNVLNTATPTHTPTNTPTGTATATDTPTPAPDGADCQVPAQCLSTFCVDGVCCNTACSGGNVRCDIPPSPGVCTAIPQSPAPAMSPLALLLGVVVLVLIAAKGAKIAWRRDGY